MKCMKCKMDIPKGAKVCPYCGSKQGMGCGTKAVIAILVIVGVVMLINAINAIMSGYRSAEESHRNTISSRPAQTTTVSRQDYINGCSEIAYSDLARNPNKYKGKSFVFTGKVIQVAEPAQGNTVYMRINVTRGEYIWKDTIFAQVDLLRSADRILEGDIITLYGDCDGLYSYESVIGEQVSIPKIDILYFDIGGSETSSEPTAESAAITAE